jgi:hypothetical protein
LTITLGISTSITVAPAPFSAAIASSMTLACAGFSPPRGRSVPAIVTGS